MTIHTTPSLSRAACVEKRFFRGEPAKRFYEDAGDFEKRKRKDFFVVSDSDNHPVTFETRYQKKDGSILEAETVLKRLRIIKVK